MRLDRHAALAVLATAVLAAPARAQATPPASGPDRVRLVLNAAFWPATTRFSDTRTFTEYAESTTLRASYEADGGFGPDGAVQVSLFRGLGVLVGYSRFRRDVSGSVEVSRPHPLYLNRHRAASAEISGYDLTEGALHLDLAYARAAGPLDWAIFGGVTLFQVEADLLRQPAYDDVYPYDELVITATPPVTVEESPTGFNVGGRLDYRFGRSRRFGAGVQVTYSSASATLQTTPEAAGASLDVGGLSIAAGVRVYF